MQNTTFVTSCFDISNIPFKTLEWRIQHFLQLAQTNICLCVYCCRNIYDILVDKHNIKKFSNVQLICIEFHESWTARQVELYENNQGHKIELPSSRNPEKDTLNYMIAINAKIEFLRHAATWNPWEKMYFAYIDFNICHVFRNPARTLRHLQWISKYGNTNKLIIPGCWDKPFAPETDPIAHITESVYWRFCGGFMFGNKATIGHFYNRYQQLFPVFLSTHHKISWEVNIWSWMESQVDGIIEWVYADHDDGIITNFPVQNLVACLQTHCMESAPVSCPTIDGFHASSASFLQVGENNPFLRPDREKQMWLNIRYVNYTLSPEGRYLFPTEDKTIISKNMVLKLHPETLDPMHTIGEVKEEYLNHLEKYAQFSRGIEDVRMFTYEICGLTQIRYIGTTVEHCEWGGSRMILGGFRPNIPSFADDSRVIQPPISNANSFQEKNWSVIPVGGQPLFIYSFCPLRIGEIDADNQLVIKYEDATEDLPFFHQLRGSTVFSRRGTGEWIGVAHFSVCDNPRQYYHMLVELESRAPYAVKKYSAPFYFQNIGIEFCIGFKLQENKQQYTFWFSSCDRDLTKMVIAEKEIEMFGHVKRNGGQEYAINKFINVCLKKDPKPESRIQKAIVYAEFTNWLEKNNYQVGEIELLRKSFYKVMDAKFGSQDYEWWCNLSFSEHIEILEDVLVK